MVHVAEQLDFVQNGRVTKRYHGLPMLDYQRVDAHSYGVAMLARLLIGDVDPLRRARLVDAALEHDLAEWHVGDIPAPTKRLTPGLREACGAMEAELMETHGFYAESALDARDKRALKLADALEGCLHCIEERRAGNAHPRLLRCFYEFWKYATMEQEFGSIHAEFLEVHEVAMKRHIESMWFNANGEKW